MKFTVAVLLLVACVAAVFGAEEAAKDKRAIAYSGLGYGAYPYAAPYAAAPAVAAHAAYPYAAGYGIGAYPYAAGLGAYPYYG